MTVTKIKFKDADGTKRESPFESIGDKLWPLFKAELTEDTGQAILCELKKLNFHMSLITDCVVGKTEIE